ncbi:MAG: hypothetical protein IJG16_06640 [Clostridia bacterium]|nr:hypothetical protein [Clostridia bacterium]
MKKILIIVAIMCGLVGISVQAANGDVIGHIYSTDIRAYINGVEVCSYNIGGRTVAVLEDIMPDVNYRDELRALTMYGYSFNPDYISEGEAEHSLISGNIIGDIYETDIKAYMYDAEIPSYNIGGKTAVALEDLGGFKEYNEYGGRYFYDDNKRTLTLEILYGKNIHNALRPANLKFTLNDDKSKVNAEFYGDPFLVGGNTDFGEEFADFENKENSVMLPVMTTIGGEEKQLGWYVGHKRKNIEFIGIMMGGQLLTNGYAVDEEKDDFKEVYDFADDYISFVYLFDDVVKEGSGTVIIPELSARDKTLRDFLWHHVFYEKDRLETDGYLFVYGSSASTHGANAHLLLIQNDGSYHDYRSDFKSVSLHGEIWFDNVSIDKDNEKCYFRYDKDYIIDLQTGEMKEVNL